MSITACPSHVITSLNPLATNLLNQFCSCPSVGEFLKKTDSVHPLFLAPTNKANSTIIFYTHNTTIFLPENLLNTAHGITELILGLLIGTKKMAALDGMVKGGEIGADAYAFE